MGREVEIERDEVERGRKRDTEREGGRERERSGAVMSMLTT